MNVLNLLDSLLGRGLMAFSPLLMGTVGSILTERSGVLCLGVEGMMAVGTIAAFIAALSSGSVILAVLAAAAAGALLALVHAFLSVTLRANQTVSGLALVMVGTGLASLAGKPYVGHSLAVRSPSLRLPFLSGIPILGQLFSQDLLFYLALAAAILAWFYLKRTRGGIALRTVGENPRAAEALGIRVGLTRYLATVSGGALIGMAGAQLPLTYSPTWIEGFSGGRGWIIVALAIFSLWNPRRALVGAFLYASIFILQFQLQGLGIPASLLAGLPFGLTLVVMIVDGLRRDRRKLAAPGALGESFKPGDR